MCGDSNYIFEQLLVVTHVAESSDDKTLLGKIKKTIRAFNASSASGVTYIVPD